MVRRPVTLVAAAVTLGSALIGCRSGDAPTVTTGSSPSSPAETSAGTAAPEVSASASVATPVPEPGTVPAPPVPVIDTAAPSTPPAPPSNPEVVVSDPPQTGVPGALDSPFCRAYGTMVVTVYLVGLVEAFGDEVGARRAEVVAAGSFSDAFDAAVAALAEVGPTTDPFGERWSGYGDRARFVLGSGVAAGALSEVWQRVLAGHDRNDPGLVIELAPPLSASVDAAAAELEQRRGSLAVDENYRSAAGLATPDVDRYVAEHCPEVAVASTGDAV